MVDLETLDKNSNDLYESPVPINRNVNARRTLELTEYRSIVFFFSIIGFI